METKRYYHTETGMGRRIVDKGKTQRRIDPDWMAEQLGAEEITDASKIKYILAGRAHFPSRKSRAGVYHKISPELVEFNGNSVLVINYHTPAPRIDEPWWTVAGYVVGEYKKPQEKTVPVTEVKPISNESEKKELEALLKEKHGEDSRIFFW